MRTPLQFKTLAFAATFLFGVEQMADAAGIWDAGTGGGNIHWSSLTNWDDNATPAAKDIIFTNTGGAAGTTVTSIVDTSYTIDSLNFLQNSTVNHSLSISNGQTLTVNGSFTPTTGEATAVLFGQPDKLGATGSITNITGLGTFTVNSAANHFLVGYVTTTSSATATVNMSGLSNFIAIVDIFGVGRKGTTSADSSRQQAGVLTLSINNTITANQISVGDTTHIGGTTGVHNNGNTSTLNLGSGGSAVNNLYADKMSFGIGKAVGNLNFAAGVVGTDTVKIRAKNTTGAVGTFEVGIRNLSSSSGAPSGTVNFGAGKVDALIATLTVGQWASGANTSGVDPSGTFTMGTNAASTVTVTTLNLANSGSAGDPGPARVVTGSLNVTGGVFSVTTVNLATGSATPDLTKIANLNVDGGTFRFGTFGTPTGTNDVNIDFKSGTVASIDATNRTLSLAYNLGKAGGSTVTFGQSSGGTGTIALNGAGTLVDATTVETLVNTTIGAGNLGGATALTKTGASTLTLNGTIAASVVTITVGTVLLDANDRLSNTATVTVAGGILDTTASNRTDTVADFNMSSGSLNGGGIITAPTYDLTGGAVNAKLGTGNITVNGTVSMGSAGRLNTGSNLTVQGGQLTLGGAESVAKYSHVNGTLTGGSLMSATDFAVQEGLIQSVLQGSVGAIKTGSGSVSLSGNNTFNGTLTVKNGTVSLNATAVNAKAVGKIATMQIDGGTLFLAAANQTSGSVPINLNGGTLQTSANTNNETFGTLTLSANSNLTLTASDSTQSLTFSDYVRTGGVLTIFNWTGSQYPGPATAGRIFVGTSLSVSELGNITFDTFGPGALQLGSGEIVPVPEPGTIAVGLGLLGLIGYRERKRIRGWFKA